MVPRIADDTATELRHYSSYWFSMANFVVDLRILAFAGMVEAEDDRAAGRDRGPGAAAVLHGFDLDDEGAVLLPFLCRL